MKLLSSFNEARRMGKVLERPWKFEKHQESLEQESQRRARGRISITRQF